MGPPSSRLTPQSRILIVRYLVKVLLFTTGLFHGPRSTLVIVSLSAPSMSSVASAVEWANLLNHKKEQLVERGCTTSGISSEAVFRDHFEDACRRSRERRHTLIIANLLQTYSVVAAFTSAIDQSAALGSPDDLTGLLWAASYAAVEASLLLLGQAAHTDLEQACLNAGCPIHHIVDLLVYLNKGVPHLGAALSRFPGDLKVQRPLQELFGEYIDCILAIVAQYAHFETHSSCEYWLQE